MGAALYFDSTFNEVDSTAGLADVQFGPMGSSGTNGATTFPLGRAFFSGVRS